MTKRAYSPKEILLKTYKTIPWGGEWERCFGTPSVNEVWFISGPSASGKSGFVMQLAKELCNYGVTLYMSYEEGVSQSFKQRVERFHMNECQGKFRVVTDDTFDDLVERLKRPKGPSFVIVDSFQYSHWTYEQVERLRGMFPRKGFIFVSQESKGRPMGKPAERLKYMAGVKIRVVGYEAVCQGRFIPAPGTKFKVWEEGYIKITNNIE
jgi:hypothetical protein